MFECTITDEGSLKCLTAKGRIDALSSGDLQKIFDDLILSGKRTLLVDMSSVHYISSVGLRVFIGTQKTLKKVGGEIILSGLTEPVHKIFSVSGLLALFRMVTDKEAASLLFHQDRGPGERMSWEVETLTMDYIKRPGGRGRLFTVGSQEKMEKAAYSEADVVSVRPLDMRFGCGLASLGDLYEEYKLLFGESMAANNTFLFYPAVKHPSVDFLINAHEDPALTYKFFHGFGFSGEYHYLLSFQGKNGSVDLPSLLNGFFAVSSANLLGIVLIAESKGLWGMHIKRVPLAEKKPANGKSIFDHSNFSEWIDFPVEPSYVNNTVVATGIAVRDRSCLGLEKASLISEGSTFHLHGAVFDKSPFGSDIRNFNEELGRIFNEHEVYKIQHLLGQSRFSKGLAAFIELET
jgi:anti-anti-sigma factor